MEATLLKVSSGNPDATPLRPSDWYEIAFSFYDKFPEAERPSIALGVYLQEVDLAIARYLRTEERIAKNKASDEALSAIGKAHEESVKLLKILLGELLKKEEAGD